MSLLVSGIIEVSKDKIVLWIKVCVDDWTAEITIMITALKSSCGKVMFPQARVKNSVRRGRGVCVSQNAMGRGVSAQGVYIQQTQRQPPPDPEADTPPPMTIEAGGTHPTGIHSCSS